MIQLLLQLYGTLSPSSCVDPIMICFVEMYIKFESEVPIYFYLIKVCRQTNHQILSNYKHLHFIEYLKYE